MNVATVAAGIATNLQAIDGLRVFDYAPDNAAVPFAIVKLPESIEFDSVYQRGADTAIFTVVIGVSRASDRSAAPALAAYLDGSGDRSVKDAIEADGGVAGTQTVRVQSARIASVQLAGTDFLGAEFSVEVVG